MMEIVDVEIAPVLPTHVTPLELIEDFADSNPGWHFLDDDSELYARERGSIACVIRVLRGADGAPVEYAFAGMPDRDESSLRLVLLCSCLEMDAPEPRRRPTHVRHFLDAFNSYLRQRPSLVNVRPIELEMEELVGG